ncbi:MAG: O-antigen biosynthesis protein RfbC [Bacteroidota bacterium]|jgi:GT2 family glycosyltransferase
MSSQAIVILNYNGKAQLERYLPSVVATSPGWDIIVADNGSTDDSLDFLTANYPSVKQRLLPVNVGFAQGYNDALAQLDGYTYYFILNSDVRLSENWDSPLLSFLEQHPEVAAVQPKILSDRKPDHFEHAGAAGGFVDLFYYPFCRGRLFAHCEEAQDQYPDAIRVSWTSGAAMLIRAHDFHAVNGFDGRFFAHMEEIDLCMRLGQNGRQFYCVPQATVWHYGGATLDYENPQKSYLNFRNSLYMLVKNQQKALLLVLFIRMCLDGIAALQFLVKGKPNLLWQVFKAHMALYQNFGVFYRERQQASHSTYRYKGLIIWDYYAKGIRQFSQLNKRKFNS